ncbi:MAG: hypothetical protein IT383_20945 [Deltaproteobacteria bacterium]|nr:hypothetical protein [Deltaproteobacteria bacterium]
MSSEAASDCCHGASVSGGAHRAGITRGLLPEKSARGLDEVPAEVREALEILTCPGTRAVLEAALQHDLVLPADAPGSAPRGRSSFYRRELAVEGSRVRTVPPPLHAA